MTELNIEYAPKSDNNDADIWHDRIVEYLRKYLSQPFDRGDHSANDFDQTDLTMDATWNDLDCSSVVPEDAIAIIFEVWIRDASVSQVFYLRKNGNSNSKNILFCGTQVASVWNSAQGIVFCDTSRVVEYYATAGMDDIVINIKGWFK